MGSLKDLLACGQSVWLDTIRRSLITSGELTRLVRDAGLRGLTSNPTIFEKAIDGSPDYDEPLARAFRSAAASAAAPDPMALYLELMIEDIRMAADVLRPVFDESGGADGFASIEVSPRVAHDTEGTLAEARMLWSRVDRPNVMIKVPATREGIPAFEKLIGEGINVNVTLMFSLDDYDAVARAYLRGVAGRGRGNPGASVASFFVSRIDTEVDRALEAIGTPDALALRGKAAVANAKLAYRRFTEFFRGEAFAEQSRAGIRPQRVLWASTSTKNPAYPDLMYVETLIGPDTVNTMPMATLEAFRAHGSARPRAVEEGVDEARRLMARLREVGVDLDQVMAKLHADGEGAFRSSLDAVLSSIDKKIAHVATARLDGQTLTLGGLQGRVEARLDEWRRDEFAQRLWRKDPTLWSKNPLPELADRLGWLSLPRTMRESIESLRVLADEARRDGIAHVVLLGMGGSSLAPEVFQRTLGNRVGYPCLIVLDSTHPAAVRAVEERIDPARTLFLVSSKSGTTTETLSFFRYFWAKVSEGHDRPGSRFVAITDPGTSLESMARERGFRRVFPGTPDVGGRYAALSLFGLVPAALIGGDISALLDGALAMADANGSRSGGGDGPALALGAALGEAALAGRDKVTFLVSPALDAFPDWAEQLIAESTGKEGKGIVPVAGEPPPPSGAYGDDRFFVRIILEGDSPLDGPAAEAALARAGHPFATIRLNDRIDLGQEFLRWEIAVAAAGAVLQIQPFDQPDVQMAKDLARKAMTGGGSSGTGGADSIPIAASERLARALADWVGRARAHDYVSVHAYLPPSAAVDRSLRSIREKLAARTRLATTSGYGPRFLHSTGQLHKGGPNSGLFLQLLDDAAPDLPVPETDYTFGRLIRAQAFGDYQALEQRGRRVLRVHVGSDPAAGLDRLASMI